MKICLNVYILVGGTTRVIYYLINDVYEWIAVSALTSDVDDVDKIGFMVGLVWNIQMHKILSTKPCRVNDFYVTTSFSSSVQRWCFI